MRRWLLGVGWVLVAGCSGPAAGGGGLWAQQHLQAELARFRLTDAQRAETARQFELGVADEQLAHERARLAGVQADCPGPVRQPLGLSAADRLRDGIRLQVAGDQARLASLAHLALADWWLRRAAETGDSALCEPARAALAGQPTPTTPTTPTAAAPLAEDPLAGLGEATVVRDAARSSATLAATSGDVALRLYALGWTDAVRGPRPLAAYLAGVYGGSLEPSDTTPPAPALGDRSPEQMVDVLAPRHPELEPDAIYLALAAGRR